MNALFFSPHSEINHHALPEAMVADTLQKNKHKVFYVTCSGTFKNMCAAMSNSNLNENSSKKLKNKICKSCIHKKNEIIKHFGLEEVKIENFISPNDWKAAKVFLKKNKNKEIQNIKIGKIHLGKMAAYEYILNWKIFNLKLHKKQRKNYHYHLINCFIALKAAERIASSIKTDIVLMYNSNYSINNTFSKPFKKLKIPVVSIHNGFHKKYRDKTLIFYRHPKENYLAARSKEWKLFRHQPITKQAKMYAQEEVDEWKRAKSFWVYSNPTSEKGSKKSFFLKKGLYKKTFSVLLSSLDERFAAKLIGVLPLRPPSWFKSQQEFVSEILNIAKIRPNYYFILRVHPREFPNKREKILSPNHKYYSDLEKRLPNNVVLNSPKDMVSLHQLVKESDAAISLTSTAGLEFLLGDKPVVAANPENMFAYPPEFNYNVRRQNELLKKLDQVNANKSYLLLPSKETIYKWLYFKLIKNVFFFPIRYNLNFKSRLKKTFLRLIKKVNPDYDSNSLHYNLLLSQIPKSFKDQIRIEKYLEDICLKS